jgi:hypothetical protein
MVKILLNAGYRISACSAYFSGALRAATYRGYAHIVKLVLGACAVISVYNCMFDGCMYLSKALKRIAADYD